MRSARSPSGQDRPGVVQPYSAVGLQDGAVLPGHGTPPQGAPLPVQPHSVSIIRPSPWGWFKRRRSPPPELRSGVRVFLRRPIFGLMAWRATGLLSVACWSNKHKNDQAQLQRVRVHLASEVNKHFPAVAAATVSSVQPANINGFGTKTTAGPATVAFRTVAHISRSRKRIWPVGSAKSQRPLSHQRSDTAFKNGTTATKISGLLSKT